MEKDSTRSIKEVLKWLIILVPISIILGNSILNINILLIDILFIYFIFKDKLKFSKTFIYVSQIFTLILFLNNLISSDHPLSFRASIGILRYFIFFMAFTYFLNDEKFKNLFFKIIFYVIMFVSVDVLFQYFFGKDLFGNEYSIDHGKRLSGPFGDELVVGAYLSKLFFLGLAYLFFKSKNYYLYILYLSYIVIIIFLTQERSAFFISIISAIFFILFFKINIKYKFIFFLLLSVLVALFIRFDETSSKKYFQQTVMQLGLSDILHKRSGDHSHHINTFWDSRYGAHFLTAFEIYKDNKIFGSGVKTFRKECNIDKYENINSAYSDQRCNTHPHNIYYEILSEGGILLFIPFCLAIIFIVLKNLQNLISYKNNFFNLLNLSILIILFFPIQTTGSFFSTFNGIFYWIGLAVVINNMRLNFLR